MFMEQKIDIHNHTFTVEELKNTTSKTNYNLIKDFLKACELGQATISRSRKKRECGTRRLTKIYYIMKVIIKDIKKDLDKLNKKDVENYITLLTRKKLSDSTKADYKMILIKFLRWQLKENDKFHELTDWIGIDIKKKEVPYLSEEQVNSMLRKCNTIKQKILITFLFDSGARIEEFLNIRISDLIKVEDDKEDYYKVTLRGEWSKTAGRTIGLFWKSSTELIELWLEELEDLKNKDKNFNPQGVLFPSTYDGCRVLLYKIALRSLGRKINPHLLRHSSATYYADKMDRTNLCNRYGWAYSSNMPDIYINRTGVKEKKIADEFKAMKNKDLMKELDDIKEASKIEKLKSAQELENIKQSQEVMREELRLEIVDDIMTNLKKLYKFTPTEEYYKIINKHK